MSEWGGARPGAGRKPIDPIERNLRDAVRYLDSAADALAKAGPDYMAASEMLTAAAAALRSRAAAAHAASRPIARGAAIGAAPPPADDESDLFRDRPNG